MSEFEIAPSSKVRAGGATLPFARRDLESDEAVLVHIKVLSTDLVERDKTMRAVHDALEKVRVNGKQVAAIVTGEDVEISMAIVKNIAAHVTPHVMNSIGLGSPQK